MQTTIRIPPTSTPGPAPEPTPAPSTLLGRYARLSVIIAVMFSLATLAASVATLFSKLDGGVLAALDAGTRVCLWGLALSWFAGGLGGGILTGWLEIWIPYRNERDDRDARKPTQEIEKVPMPTATGELLELYGWRALAYQLMQEHETDLTREIAEKMLHIPQRAYNKLNTVFVAMGIKTEKAWIQHEDLLPMLLYDRVTFDPDGSGAWVDRKHIFFKE